MLLQTVSDLFCCVQFWWWTCLLASSFGLVWVWVVAHTSNRYAGSKITIMSCTGVKMYKAKVSDPTWEYLGFSGFLVVLTDRELGGTFIIRAYDASQSYKMRFEQEVRDDGRGLRQSFALHDSESHCVVAALVIVAWVCHACACICACAFVA